MIPNCKKTDKEIESLNKSNTYSTEEQRIGTWIDGKTLYRKVIEFGKLASTTNVINHTTTLASENNIVRAEGYAVNQKIIMPLSYAGQNNNGISFNVSVNIATDTYQITIQCASDRSEYEGYAIIEYTKK